MSFVKLILAGVLVFASAAQAQEFKCPGFHGKKLLFNTAVFDGPPKEMVELEPDHSGGKTSYTWASWDIGYQFTMGHTLFLNCWYGSLKDTEIVTIKADKPVQKCVFRTHGAGLPAEMICK